MNAVYLGWLRVAYPTGACASLQTHFLPLLFLPLLFHMTPDLFTLFSLTFELSPILVFTQVLLKCDPLIEISLQSTLSLHN